MIDGRKSHLNAAEILDTHVVKGTFDNLIQPPAKAAGELLAKPFSLLSIFGDAILYFPEKLRLHMKHNLEKTTILLDKKLKAVSDKELVEPDPSVQIAVLEAVAKTYDSDNLRELFANLLLKASLMKTQYMIHPAYVEIISRITPYDAEFISALFKSENHCFPLFNILYNVSYNNEDSENTSKGMYRTAIYKNLVAPLREYDNLELTALSITQLKSLGIISVEPEFYNKTLLFETEKEKVKGLELYKNASNRFAEFRVRIEKRNNLPINLTTNINKEYLDINTYKVEFSDFGLEFAKICISSDM